MHQSAHIQEARDYILNRIHTKPAVGMILGSGLGALADEIENATVIPYTDIPYFAQSEAIGHANELVIGELMGKTVVAMKAAFIIMKVLHWMK